MTAHHAPPAGLEIRAFNPDRVRMLDNCRGTEIEFDEGFHQSIVDTKGPAQPPLGYLADQPDDPSDVDLLLICGERRLLSMQRMKAEHPDRHPTFPFLVRPRPSRKEFLTLNLVENLQRENLPPSRVADRLAYMLTETDPTTGLPLFSQQSLADEIGKDKRFLVRALGSRSAPQSVRDAVDAGECSLDVAAQIGALPESLRERAAAEIVHRPLGAMTREQSSAWIAERYRRYLPKADFTVDDDTLTETLPGSGDRPETTVTLPPCTQCQWWGGNRDDVGGKHGDRICLYPACYDRKQAAWLRRSSERETGRTARLIPDDLRDRVLDPITGRVAADSGYIDIAERPAALLVQGGEATAATLPPWRKILETAEPETHFVYDEGGARRELVETAVALRGALGSTYARHFRDDIASRFESKDERQSRLRSETAAREAQSRVRADALTDLARGLIRAAGRETLEATVRLTWESACPQRDDADLALRALRTAAGRDWSDWDDAIREATAEELEASLVLLLQSRRARLEGWGTWAEEDSPMHTLCTLAEWDRPGWDRELAAAVRAAEKETAGA